MIDDGSAGLDGLDEATASRRLATEGPNELTAARSRTVPRVVLEVAREPMFILLLAAGTLYLAMGDPGDALVLLAFVLVVMGITIAQTRRTERALDALRDLSSPRALVVRDGHRRRIPGREVVRGDVLLLNEGDRVPADAVLRRSTDLGVDESLLTGESVPVRKVADGGSATLQSPGAEGSHSLYAGTLVTSGQGLAQVVATGGRTALGRIGRSLARIEVQPTPLQQETGHIVRRLAVAGLAVCAIVAVAYGLSRGASWTAWKEGLLVGIVMAMAILPEEFPVILTVFLALGAWRISRNRVLTRRLPVIETLGSATVLCVDKTGTLTCNQMTLQVLATEQETLAAGAAPAALPPGPQQLLRTAALASKPDAFDPMERALHAAQAQWPGGSAPAEPAPELVRAYPLEPALLAVSYCWRRTGADTVLVATKGAPEAIATLCRLDPRRRAWLDAQVRDLAARGLRILGVAETRMPAAGLPADQSGLRPRFLGLVAFEDPLRANVPQAVAECRTAGIRVVMITGDNPRTACSIARQAGLDDPDTVLTGPQLADLSDAALADRVRNTQVFARVVPDQKLRIVQALRANAEVVAMTGDGVNDAPALKAAHIGIAMGGRGTDVAREAASLVLLDDDFSSIVTAIRLGRRIYDNIRKAVSFTLAVHVPIVGLSMIPVLLPGWPLLLLPVHVAFLQLVIDPSCTLVFEAEAVETDVMRRPPRSPVQRLFSGSIVRPAILQGFGALAVSLAIVAVARQRLGPDAARTLSFASLVVSLLAIILVNRSWTRTLPQMLRAPNTALKWVLSLTVLGLATVLSVPALQRLFSFSPVPPAHLALSLAAGFLGMLGIEGIMRWRRTGLPSR